MNVPPLHLVNILALCGQERASAAATASEAPVAPQPAFAIPEPQLAKRPDDEEEAGFKVSAAHARFDVVWHTPLSEIREAQAFTGSGARLDGKALKPGQVTTQDDSKPAASTAASRAAAAADARLAAATAPAAPRHQATKWSKTKRGAFAGSGATLG